MAEQEVLVFGLGRVFLKGKRYLIIGSDKAHRTLVLLAFPVHFCQRVMVPRGPDARRCAFHDWNSPSPYLKTAAIRCVEYRTAVSDALLMRARERKRGKERERERDSSHESICEIPPGCLGGALDAYHLRSGAKVNGQSL